MRSNTPPFCLSCQMAFFRAVRAIKSHEAVELTAIPTKRSIANAR